MTACDNRSAFPMVRCSIARSLRAAAPQPAPVGHRPLQPALPLLHAGGRLRLAAARERCSLRGNRGARRRLRRARRRSRPASPAANRCSAATCPTLSRSWRRSRRPRPGADDQRRAARRPGRRAARRPACTASRSASTRCDRDRFEALTRFDELPPCLAGIDAASRAGFDALKLDTVVIRGTNDDELVDADRVRARRRRRDPLHRVHGRRRRHPLAPRRRASRAARCSRGSTAHYGPIDAARRPRLGARPTASACRTGRRSGSSRRRREPFCADCDRSRLTADGVWLLCLYAAPAPTCAARCAPARRREELRAADSTVWSAARRPRRRGAARPRRARAADPAGRAEEECAPRDAHARRLGFAVRGPQSAVRGLASSSQLGSGSRREAAQLWAPGSCAEVHGSSQDLLDCSASSSSPARRWPSARRPRSPRSASCRARCRTCRRRSARASCRSS